MNWLKCFTIIKYILVGIVFIRITYIYLQWLATGRWFSPGIPVSSTYKTDCHDIAEILLKVALNIINLNPNLNIPLHFVIDSIRCMIDLITINNVHTNSCVSGIYITIHTVQVHFDVFPVQRTLYQDCQGLWIPSLSHH